MKIYERTICAYPGCVKKTRNKGFYRGKRRYDKYCEYHHRQRYAEKSTSIYKQIAIKEAIDNSKCEVCGWDKAYCDRHRIDPNKGYFKENITILCPNCHRLEGLGLLK